MQFLKRAVTVLPTALALLVSVASHARADEATSILDRIEETEYEIGLHDGAHQAFNRAHGFRARFEPGGLVVVPAKEEEAWTWGLAWTAYGTGSLAWSVPPATLSTADGGIVYRRGVLREWYDNGLAGLKQSFFLPVPPEEWAARSRAEPRKVVAGLPEGAIHLEMALLGDLSPSVSSDGQAIEFQKGGKRVLRYDRLVVTDARGSLVPARMDAFVRAGVRGIRIVIDPSDAVFPITVDPLATTPAWTAEANQSTAFLGTSVAIAGDVNGDGYSDVILGAYGFSNGQTDEGRAFLFLGTPSGLSSTPAWTAESDQAGANFGRSVATAGDINGDGYSDVLVGAPQFNNGQPSEGRAYLYLGGPSGLSPTPAWTAESNRDLAQFGYAVASAGDVNGDGYADVIVGSPTYNSDQLDEGRVWVFHGSAAGLSATANWIGEANQAGAAFGWSVGTAGDVDGDGFAEVIVGAYLYDNGHTDEGRSFVYRGSAFGLEPSPLWTGESNNTGAHYGFSVATAGDVNGDGYADVIVGARRYGSIQTAEGRAYVYHGSSTGLAAPAAWSYESNLGGIEFGCSVASAGDVDGDGYAEVVVGAHLWDAPLRSNAGKVYAFAGSPSGLSSVESWTVEGTQSTRLGASVATAGDVNGDGYADVVVGEPEFFGPSVDEGRAHVYHGSADGVPSAIAAWTRDPSLAGLYLGIVSSAGDVNGDGYADFLIGIPNWKRAELYHGSASGPPTLPDWTAFSEGPNEPFASSLGAAGDVNGDGYGDVIVGAELHSAGGRAYVYHGSASGLATTPSWTVDGGSGSGNFARSVASAGDVNGDGYGDVLVGAPVFDNGELQEGRVVIYLGSASGLSAVPSWAQEGDQISAFVGADVSTAGDVNRDGYSDVLVNWAGQAKLFLGSASGLAADPAWSGGTAVSILRSAGDVNGDGYADVILGEPFADGAAMDQGRASVYLGYAGGLSTAPAWTSEGTQTTGLRGQGVTSGDVNGDGYADVLVGASGETNGQTNEGRAYIFLGSPSGLPPAPDWVAESNIAAAYFGHYVASAGDVNGDGYADVLIASPQSDAITFDGGRVHLYYGNGRRGTPVAPRPRASDDSRPVARLGASDAPDSLRFASRGLTPFGRGMVRLEAEVKPLGVPFDGSGTHLSAPADGAGTVQVLADGLPPSTPLHWRVRLRPNPATTPLAGAGRWITMPWGGWNEAMLRTSSASEGPLGRTADVQVGRSGSDVTVTWEPGCLEGQQSYAVYEGALGAFTSHLPVICSTAGPGLTFTAQAGNRYFLVVPQNASFEGSYGTNSGGVERTASTAACKPQNLAACP